MDARPGGARPPEFWAGRAQNYLERYAYILLFAAYALEEVHQDFWRDCTRIDQNCEYVKFRDHSCGISESSHIYVLSAL